MNKKNILNFGIVLWVFVAVFCLFQNTEAATIYMSPAQKDVKLGEVFPIEIMIDEPTQNINAVQAKLSSAGDFLKFNDASDGGSIVTYWAEKPNIDASGAVSFQGAILEGFSGKEGKLLTIYAEALQSGQVKLAFDASTSAYLNDGKGTEIKATLNGAVINIGKEKGGNNSISIIDNTPPETLEAKISNSEDIFNGQYFLAFAAKDNGSGIDYIEIKEGDLDWLKAESPYLLVNQKIDQDIQVRAVDKNGNARTETLTLAKYQATKNTLYALVAVIIIGLIVWQIIKRKRAQVVTG